QRIFSAQNTIFIKDQFLFDRNVVLALLQKKEATPEIKIRALLEPLEIAKPKGMPNILYLNLMKEAGIDIRKPKLKGTVIINQEYHGKTISFDGETVIAGSANKDQSTMFGSFREEQLEAFDSEATKIHDQAFLDETWKNDPNTEEFDLNPKDFEFLAGYKDLSGNQLTPENFLDLLRNMLSVLYDTNRI
ncbi:MAG: hypothetical protein HY072_03450, partial [Deltaproteobacteria bacterium]|nr:hypothetical protein [Deltaproteobacteria bacterium]